MTEWVIKFQKFNFAVKTNRKMSSEAKGLDSYNWPACSRR